MSASLITARTSDPCRLTKVTLRRPSLHRCQAKTPPRFAADTRSPRSRGARQAVLVLSLLASVLHTLYAPRLEEGRRCGQARWLAGRTRATHSTQDAALVDCRTVSAMSCKVLLVCKERT